LLALLFGFSFSDQQIKVLLLNEFVFSFSKMDDVQAGHKNTSTAHKKAQGRKKREAQANTSPVISKNLFMAHSLN